MPLRKTILITIDSLRADYSEPIVASVSRILGKSINKIAFANGPGTPQSFPAILASSSFLLLNSDFSVPSYMTTLPEILSKYNFITVGIHSNPYLSRVFGWHKGFKIFHDHYDEVSSPLSSVMKSMILRKILSILTKSKHTYMSVIPKLRKFYQTLISIRASKPPYVDAKDITDIAHNILDLYKDNNLFLWIHYMDTHWPYNIPYDGLANKCGFNTAKQALRFLYKIPISFITTKEIPDIDKCDLDKMKCLYKMSIIYVSKNIENLFTLLQELDLLDETLVVLTGDHGEAFLEHGALGHPFYTLYNENLYVPIIIWHPHLQTLYDDEIPIQLREIPSFMLKALKLKTPKSWIKSASLLEHLIFAESAYVDPVNLLINKNKYIIAATDGRYKLILDRIKERIELYDIKNDPKEKNNIVYNESEIVEEMLKGINRFLISLSIKRAISRKLKMKAKR